MSSAAGPLIKKPFNTDKHETRAFKNAVVYSRPSPPRAQVLGNIEHCSDTALRLKYTQIRPGEQQKTLTPATHAHPTYRTKHQFTATWLQTFAGPDPNPIELDPDHH